PHALREAWYAQAFTLIISPFQREELEDVLNRPKIFAKYPISLDERIRLLRRLDEDSEKVDPAESLSLPLRDAKDERILGTALAAQADFLVTGDKDLHAVAGDPRLGRLRIVTVADFLAVLEERALSDAVDEEDSKAKDEVPGFPEES